MITITELTLASLAAAARLAKAGDEVTIVDAALEHRDDTAIDDIPTLGLGTDIIRLPATWRDVFTSSGRPLDAVLATHGLTLTPAPPTLHRFGDGTEIALPDERGAQHHAITDAFGLDAADRWAAVLDQLDDVWQELRHFGFEEPFDRDRLGPETRARLLSRVTLRRLADELGEPHLARILVDQAALAGTQSHRAPALLGCRLVIERTFGRWYLTDADSHPVETHTLVKLLIERCRTLGVRFSADLRADADIDASLVHLPGRGSFERVWAAYAPEHYRMTDAPMTDEGADADTSGITEIVNHRGWAPVVTQLRPTPHGLVRSVWDFRRARRDLGAGLDPASFTAWTLRAPLAARRRTHGTHRFVASASNHAGPEPWALLLTGSLAAYAAHHAATGEDISPAATFGSRQIGMQTARSGAPQPGHD